MEQSPLQSTPAGALRFNTDSSKLEYYDGNQWVNITSTSPEAQTGGTRGGMATGGFNSDSQRIDKIEISTTGNAVDFGQGHTGYTEKMGCSDRTRGIYAGGYKWQSAIGYFTIASGGDGVSFGSLVHNSHSGCGCSDSTRGIIFAGTAPGWAGSTGIEYITIQTTGSNKDFGDITGEHSGAGGAMSSSTRAVKATNSPSPYSNTGAMGYVTISTLGDHADFGDLTVDRQDAKGAANAVRGLWMGGSNLNVIDYINIATLGNAVDFGDIHNQIRSGCAFSSRTRAISYCGYRTPQSDNSQQIDYVEIATTGNYLDFGDATEPCRAGAQYSNGHGGLG